MAQCSNCGFEFDEGRPAPTKCPRCGVPAQADAGGPPVFSAGPPAFPSGPRGLDSPGAPPEFSASSDHKPGATLFGLPEVEDVEHAPIFAPPGSAPVTSGPPGVEDGPAAIDLSGPPSIGLDGPAAPGLHGELELDGALSSLELDVMGSSDSGALDLPAPVAPRASALPKAPPRPPARRGTGASPPPIPDGGLDLPTPLGHGGRSLGDLDLPFPSAPTPAPRSDVSALDLPAPVAPRPGPGPKAPPPPPMHGEALGLDLPAPVGLDLPQPARSPYAPARGSAQSPHHADSMGLDSSRREANQLRPVEAGLPRPVGSLELEPAHNQLQPAVLELEPRGGTELEPSNLEVVPHDANMLEPKAAAAAAAAGHASGAYADNRPGYAKPFGPTPREIDRPGVSRGLLFGGAAVLLVGALGGGLYSAGVFDDAEPTGVVTRGAPKPGQDTSPATKSPATAAGPTAERTSEVLAKLDLDDPNAYQEAAALAEAGGDLVGAAEAKLLLDLRYGPDPVLVGEASAHLSSYAGNTESYVTRVRGLEALAKGAFADGERLLAGEGARLAQYRALLRLEQGKPGDAIVEAKAALQATPNALMPLALLHEAELSQDPSAAAAAIQKSADAHPSHPGLRELVARAALENGEIGGASQAIARLKVSEASPAAYRARVASLKGELALSQGDYGTAVTYFDEALSVAKSSATQLARVRALIATLDFTEAQVGLDQYLEGNPDSVEGAILRAELAVESGEGDHALVLIEQLEKSLPDRIEIPYLRGQVQAMRLQVDEAQAEFAKVIAKDPNYYKASIAEARMLQAGRKGVEAIAVLDAAVARLADPRAKAAVLIEKSELLLDQLQNRAALAALDAALAASPQNNPAQVLRGSLRIEGGEFASGKADLLAVYARTGGYPGLSAPLGRIFVRDGNIAELEKLVGDKADSPRASSELKLVAARLKLAQAKPEAAKVLIDEALAKEPNSWEGKMLMARAFLDSGDKEEALERIMEVRPPTPRAEVHLLRGKILEFNDRHEEARPQYLSALQIDPDQHEARFLYGRLLAYAGAAKQAIEELEVVCAATEQFPEAWLNLGRAQRDLAQFDKAVQSLDKATALDPSLYEASYLAGRIHADKNKHAAAIAALSNATNVAAQDQAWYPDALMALGRAQSKGGKQAEARASFRKFLDIAPEDHPSRPEAERQLR